MTTNATVEVTEGADIDARIAALEDEIRNLNRRWRPYAAVQAVTPGAHYAGGAGFNPSRIIERRTLDVQLAAANAALAEAQAEQARAQLDRLGDAAELRADLAASEAAEAAARATHQAARETTQESLRKVRWHDERIGTWRRQLTLAEDTAARWSRERQKNAAQLEHYQALAEQRAQMEGVAS